MIKFSATDSETGRVIFGIGLSHGNVVKLMLGQPIHFNAEELKMSELKMNEILIFVGETEEKMKEEFERNGYLDGAKIIEEKQTKQ